MPQSTTTLSSDQRRELMRRFRGKDTKPEITVRRYLHQLGYRFRLHRKDLPGRPDIVLPKHRTVVFVHGCFWHHHEGCPTARVPRSKPDYWKEKFRVNKERDARNVDALREKGWEVLTVWECEVADDRSLRAALVPLLVDHESFVEGSGSAPRDST